MPVDIATGEVSLVQEDVALPGLLPVSWTRHYSASLLDWHQSPLGPGWTSTWLPSLWRSDEAWTFRSPEGNVHLFQASDALERGEAVKNFGAFIELRRERDALVVVRWAPDDPDAVRRYVFRTQPYQMASLLEVQTAGGARVEAHCDSLGRLHALRQVAEGRQLFMNYSNTGRITAIDFKGPRGTRARLVEYEYGDEDRLKTVIDRRRLAHRYEYDDDGRLIREIQPDGAVYMYKYDGVGRCTRFSGLERYNEKRLRYIQSARTTFVTNSCGDTTSYEWLPTGQVSREIDSAGGIRETSYDRHDRIIAVSDQARAVTGYTYNADGDRDSVTTAAGEIYRFTFNERHQPTSVTDPLGNRWQRLYDESFRFAGWIDPSGAKWGIEYDEDGAPIALTNPLGARRTQRNQRGNAVMIADAAGHRSILEWDDFGRLIERIDPEGGRTIVEYDAVGNVLRAVKPDGTTTLMSWDEASNLLSVTSGEGHSVKYRYGSCSRLLEREDALGRVTRYEWGTEPERLERITNVAGETYTFSRDARGRILSERTFDGRTRSFEYDAAGRLSAIIENSGQKTELRRRDGRLVEKVFADGNAIQFEYDPCGRLSVARSPDGSVEYEHDKMGRVTGELQPHGWVRKQYNAAGYAVRTFSSLGINVRFEVDDRGQVESLRTEDGQLLRFERNWRGQCATCTNPGAYRLVHRFDSKGRLRAQMLDGPDAVGQGLSAKKAMREIDRDYDYDRDGLLTSIHDNRGAVEYEHDRAGRLVSAVGNFHWPSEHFIYDASDNIVSYQASTSPPVNCVFEPGNILVEDGQLLYAYDEDGKLLRREASQAGRTIGADFSWDSAGQLRRLRQDGAREWSYRYDALGRRISKTGPGVSLQYVWDGDAILHEEPAEGEGATWLTAPGTRVPLARVQRQELWCVVADHLGTPRELLDSSGRVVWASTQTAWGVSRIVVGIEHDCPIRFEGQWWDSESDLHYNRFRYYDPGRARFISPDPIGLLGGSNQYGYVRNPLRWTDPYGLTDCTDEGGEKKKPKGARTEPGDLQEQIAMEEARAGAGQQYRGKLGDPKYDPVTGTHDKMEYNHDHGDGTRTEIHYDRDRATGESSGFKIKDDTNAASRGWRFGWANE